MEVPQRTSYRRCGLCEQVVPREDYLPRVDACRPCHRDRVRQNRPNPHNRSRRDYLRSLSVPELRAYTQGLLNAHVGADDLAELRMIADRLEWVADSLIVAGIDGWQATYGGLRSTQVRPN